MRCIGVDGAGGGINYVRFFGLYILATQEPAAAQSFREVLRRYAPESGDDLMTYAQELLAEGRAEGREAGREAGRMEERVQMIENHLPSYPFELGGIVGSAFLGSVDQPAQLPTQRDAHAALPLAVEQKVAMVQAILKQVARDLHVFPAIRLNQIHAAFFKPFQCL